MNSAHTRAELSHTSPDGDRWRRAASLLPAPIGVIDIGARGGIEDHWAALHPYVRAYGFDPDEAECERLNRANKGVITYVPVALGGDVGSYPFYVTYDQFCSSLFRPIERLAKERPRLAEMRVREIVTTDTQTVDGWMGSAEIGRLDYLKLDAQGAELAILEGASNSLHTVRAIKLEVQFSQLYEGVPLFAEVDAFLRSRGFALWRLGELSHCGFEDASAEVHEILDYDSQRVEVLAGGGQLLWANAYYVRTETTDRSCQVDWADSVRDACLAQVHGYADLAEISLRRARDMAPSDVRTALGGPPQGV